MKAEDLFGVVVRALGIILLMMALSSLIEYLLNVAVSENYMVISVLLRQVIPNLVFGTLFTFFAESVVHITYRKRS